MHPKLEIFSQGEELVTGQIVDSNAAWLAQEAVQLGFSVPRHTAVGDKLADLKAALLEIADRADCCLCTGGLGPTCDDLTAQAVSEAFGLPLEFDEQAYQQILQFFQRRNKPMAATNRKQAMLPRGALRLDNHWGTAPGFAVLFQRCWFAFMPGVPSEMRPMFQQHIRNQLLQRFVVAPKILVTLKTIGLGESDLQQRLNVIDLPQGIELGFRAELAEVQTKLLFPTNYPALEIRTLIDIVRTRLGDFVYAVDGLDQEDSGDLVEVVDKLMISKSLSLATIETASQGMIGALCVGKSWFYETLFVRSVPELLASFALSVADLTPSAVAKCIAINKQQANNIDIVIVQIYNQTNASINDETKAIELYTVISSRQDMHACTHTVTGSNKRKQKMAALLALDFLRRYLQGNL